MNNHYRTRLFVILILMNIVSLTVSNLYQKPKKGESYEDYTKRPLISSEFQKLSMVQFYECLYNFNMIRVQRYTDDYEEYNTSLKTYCETEYITWKGFRLKHYTKILHNELEEFKLCVDNLEYSIPRNLDKLYEHGEVRNFFINCMNTHLKGSKENVDVSSIEENVLNCLSHYFTLSQDSSFRNCLVDFHYAALKIQFQYKSIKTPPLRPFPTLRIEYNVLKLLEIAFMNLDFDKNPKIYWKSLEDGFYDYLLNISIPEKRFKAFSVLQKTLGYKPNRKPVQSEPLPKAIRHETPEIMYSICNQNLMGYNFDHHQFLQQKLQEHQKSKIKQLLSITSNTNNKLVDSSVFILKKIEMILKNIDTKNRHYYKMFILSCLILSNQNNSDVTTTYLQNTITDLTEYKVMVNESYDNYLIRTIDQDIFLALTESLWREETNLPQIERKKIISDSFALNEHAFNEFLLNSKRKRAP